MTDLVVALGLVLVIEGILYGGLPQFAKRLAAEVVSVPEPVLRAVGLGAALLGLIIVWSVRG